MVGRSFTLIPSEEGAGSMHVRQIRPTDRRGKMISRSYESQRGDGCDPPSTYIATSWPLAGRMVWEAEE